MTTHVSLFISRSF